jgi:colanic acid/amylovoran biosynthesis glycosyltransferase
MNKTKKLKIAFLVNFFPKLSETFILDQVINIIKAGHEIDIYPSSFFTEKKVHKKVLDNNLLSIIHYPKKIPKGKIMSKIHFTWLLITNMTRIRVFYRLFVHPQFKKSTFEKKIRLISITIPHLNNRNYDIVHCHFGPSGLRAIFIKSLGLLKGKMVTSFYGYDVSIHRIHKGYYSELFNNCDNFIAITNYVAKRAINLGCSEEKIKIIPLGINPKDFNFVKTNESRQTIKLLSIGRLVEKKGMWYAIVAFKQLASKYPFLTYDIVGEGPLHKALNYLIHNLDLSDKITIHGAKDKEDILDFYRNSDIFILPCVTASNGDSEGQCLVLLEAQSAGLPVISTFHNGIQEGVVNDKTGFLVAEKDIKALSNRIEYFLKNPHQIIRMGQKGRNFVNTNFDKKYLLDSIVSEVYMA